MKVTLQVTIEKEDGPRVESDEVFDALIDELADLEFEAGDEPTVFRLAAVEQKQ